MLLDSGAPKVPPEELGRLIEEAGMKVTQGTADFGVVVGGDGRFSRYGRTEDIPLLFVGMRSKGAAGSKAQLARIEYDHLPRALKRIGSGDYSIDEYGRLAVLLNGRSIGEVFTDVYLQRGSDSTCIRYRVKVGGQGENFEEAAIGDGVVISTSAGSTGYYSYPDRIRGDYIDPGGFASIEKGEVGICHITPTYTERTGTDLHPLRYTVPWGSRVSLSLFREADARIYGTTDKRAGVRVSMGDEVLVRPGRKKTRVISL
ncbi:MAG TPA: hypothetical protein VED22_00700 [Nitrososphaerales archaeon]|nr:hypothetical protein [Nitrososphaerales archaeon]